MVKVAKMLKKWREELFDYIIADHSNEMCLKDIPVVSEFVDVFLEDLPSLPLDRGVKFTIELAPCTAPISKALYWMAPVQRTKDPIRKVIG